MKNTTGSLGPVSEEVWKAHSMGCAPAQQQSSVLVYAWRRWWSQQQGLPSFPSTSTYIVCNSKRPLVHGSIPYKERGWRTCRVRRGHLHLPCSCPGDLVTSGMSLTHPDLFYFKRAIIELLKYVFIPSHQGIRAMNLIGPFFFSIALWSLQGKLLQK